MCACCGAPRRAPWQCLPLTTCAEEPAFLAGPCGVRFRAPAVSQFLQGGMKELCRRRICRQGFSCAGLHRPAFLQCPNAFLPFHHPRISFLRCSVPCWVQMPSTHTCSPLDPLTLATSGPLQSHPAHASCSTIPAAAVPGCPGAMYYVRAAELACQLGGTYLLTSWPGVMCVWLCQPFGCQTGQTGVAGSGWQQNWRLRGFRRALRLVKILLCLSRS